MGNGDVGAIGRWNGGVLGRGRSATGGKAAAPPVESVDEGLADEPAQLGEGAPDAIGSTLPAIGPKVIKAARVRVEVKRGGFHDALREATAIAGTYGGFVVSSSVEGKRSRMR